MENKFATGDGLDVLLFLQEKLNATVIHTGENFIYFRLNCTKPDGDVIGFTETVKMRYRKFFSMMDLCLLFELPTCDCGLKFVFYGSFWLRDYLANEFGGFCIGNYWLLNDETRSYYGYKGDSLPEASQIVQLVENLLSA